MRIERIVNLGLSLIALGVFTTGCSTPYRTVHVCDSAFDGDRLILLLYAEKGIRPSPLHHGFERKKLRGALGIATCNVAERSHPRLDLVAYQDASNDPIIHQTIPNLASTQSCLVATAEGFAQVKIPNKGHALGSSADAGNSLQIPANRVWLTPSRRMIVACGNEPFVVDAETMRPVLSDFAQLCVLVLCQPQTNGGRLGPIFAIGDRLTAVARQDVNSVDAWNTFSVWNFAKGKDSRVVRTTGDLLSLEAVQVVNDSIWLLLSNRLRNPDHPKAVLIDEDGKNLGETEMFGSRVIVDTSFDRVAFLAQNTEKNEDVMQIKIWYPKLQREKLVKIPTADTFKTLYRVWDTQ